MSNLQPQERPIPLNGAMVRAILHGNKSVTRRVMKLQPDEHASITVEHYNATLINRQGDEEPGPEIFGAWWRDGEIGCKCPYGQPGDLLWVKESWSRDFSRHYPYEDVWYRADGERASEFEERDGVRGIWSPEHNELVPFRWRSGRFMPRRASRILLEITGICIERLQDITDDQAVAEGVRQMSDGSCCYVGREGPGKLVTPWLTAKEAFADQWDDVNGRGSWESNPWVWCVEFKRVRP